jgi:hypothetical protein
VHDHCTLGAGGARTRTGVAALFVDAGPVARAVRVDEALGPTVGRHTHIPGQARAGGNAVGVAALRVAAAGVRLAGVGGTRCFCADSLSCHCKQETRVQLMLEKTASLNTIN